MNKCVLFLVFLVTIATSSLEAQWRYCGPRCCVWGCRQCFVDPVEANYDGILYGYMDNINYPDTYRLPLNCCINYCQPCRYKNYYNWRYLENCIHYTNQKNGY